MALTQYPGSAGTQPQQRSGTNKRALCIGINAYDPRFADPLGGCVNDAFAWSDAFRSRGFQVSMLTDGNARRSAILNEMRSLIQGASSGDVVAIQYSGHGTQMHGGGDEPTDEAIMPVDHQFSGLIIDDDIAEICNLIPAGVNVTFIMDCCFAGTNTRHLFRGTTTREDGVRVRFCPAPAVTIEATRAARAGRRSSTRSPYAGQPEILFAACNDQQLSQEWNGLGRFTRAAINVLHVSGSLTNAQLIDQTRATGTFVEQRPELWSDPKFWDTEFLAPHADSSGSLASSGSSGGGGGGSTPTTPPATTSGQPTFEELMAAADALLRGIREVRGG